MFAMLAIRIPDLLVSATLLTTYGGVNTVMLLLVDFTGLVVSPDDYGVLGHRPVSSRTYFAARLTSILAYIGFISAVLALLPAICYAFWWRPGHRGPGGDVCGGPSLRHIGHGHHHYGLRDDADARAPSPAAPRVVLSPARLDDGFLRGVLPLAGRFSELVPVPSVLQRSAMDVGESGGVVRGIRATRGRRCATDRVAGVRPGTRHLTRLRPACGWPAVAGLRAAPVRNDRRGRTGHAPTISFARLRTGGIACRRPARRRAVPLRSALPHGDPRHRPADPVLPAARTESGRAGRSLSRRTQQGPAACRSTWPWCSCR